MIAMVAIHYRPCPECGTILAMNWPCEPCARDAAWVDAIEVAQHGGDCNCTDENAKFDVTLRDGRVFRNGSIHGSGGVLRGRLAYEMAIKLLAHRETIRFYLAWRWWGEWYVDIPVGDVSSIGLVPPP